MIIIEVQQGNIILTFYRMDLEDLSIVQRSSLQAIREIARRMDGSEYQGKVTEPNLCVWRFNRMKTQGGHREVII